LSSSYRFTVTGQVQGVGFRYSALAQARRLGVRGWIGNRDDGAVEGVAGGETPALEAFREWLRQGPRLARVERLDWSETSEATPPGFEIRR
jgi:acylphosphatase